MTNAIYPGTFDPVTFGHVDIATRAARIFDHVTVSIYDRPMKNLTFDAQERVVMMQTALKDVPNIDVKSYAGLTVNFARECDATVIVRGLRVMYDFELEYQMALTNQKLGPDLDTVCLMTSLEYAFVSSSIVKEVFRAGGCIEGLVPPHVITALQIKTMSPAANS